jgi:ATP-binding cassette subfamily C protein/ATP-binding cassette subfamily C protein LapB
MEMVRKLHGKATVIMSTQRPSHMKIADRVAILKSGQIAMAGTPEQIVPIIMGIPQQTETSKKTMVG